MSHVPHTTHTNTTTTGVPVHTTGHTTTTTTTHTTGAHPVAHTTPGVVHTGPVAHTGPVNGPASIAVPIVGDSHKNVVTGSNIAPGVQQAGGPLGGGILLGGQCECLRNGGTCKHGAGQCNCRGCVTPDTTVNPGVNVGVSTGQI